MKTLNIKAIPGGRAAAVVTTGLLLALSAACSQEASEQPVVDTGLAIQGFTELDGNDDARLTWEELNQVDEEQLRRRGWSREVIFEQFDQNGDDALNEDEYRRLAAAFQSGASPADVEPVVTTESGSERNLGGSAPQQDVNDANWPAFGAVETNSDGSIDWSELTASYGDELSQVGWTEQQVMDQYDQNNNDALEEGEFTLFRAEITAANPQPQTDAERAQPQTSIEGADAQGDAGAGEQPQSDQLADRPAARSAASE